MYMEYIFRVIKQEIAKSLCQQGLLDCIFYMAYIRFESSLHDNNVHC